MAEMIVFKNENFQGETGTFSRDLPYVGDFWNDKITSVKVTSGVWEVFEEADFAGGRRTLTPGNYPNLAKGPAGIGNDSISSVKIIG